MLLAFSMIAFFGCASDEESPTKPGNGNGDGSTITYDYTETQEGTYTSTATQITSTHIDTQSDCSSGVYITEIDTVVEVSTYILSGNTVVVTSIDTSWEDTVIEYVKQEVITLVRDDTGTGIVGTWISTDWPVDTILDSGTLGDGVDGDIDEEDLIENLKIVATFNSDSTYSTSFSIDLKSDWESVFAQEWADIIKEMITKFGGDTGSPVITTGANSVTVSHPALTDNLTLTIGGTFPDATVTIKYGTRSGTMPMEPGSSADCAGNEYADEIFKAFVMDLVIAQENDVMTVSVGGGAVDSLNSGILVASYADTAGDGPFLDSAFNIAYMAMDQSDMFFISFVGDSTGTYNITDEKAVVFYTNGSDTGYIASSQMGPSVTGTVTITSLGAVGELIEGTYDVTAGLFDIRNEQPLSGTATLSGSFSVVREEDNFELFGGPDGP
jgi:hypothetical protein